MLVSYIEECLAQLGMWGLNLRAKINREPFVIKIILCSLPRCDADT